MRVNQSLRRFRRTLILACSILLAPTAVGAQDAVVLSGGGARGLAHIGVLEQLSELGYDPDLIIGNSIGAVVGALYAAGYTPAEIRQRTLAFDWGAMFEPTPILLGAERTARLPMLTFSVGVGDRRIARGLFGDWRINRALVHLLFEANAVAQGDFDRLRRRFRAVAADLETGTTVVLGTGDLARAVRASMAYPGFLAPVLWGDRVLIDGGIADNLPTIEARKLGASHIIAVDVSRPGPEISSLDPMTVIQRSVNLMQVNLQPDPLPPDILILPHTEAVFGGLAFPDDPVPLIELGAQAARAALPPVQAQPSDGMRSRPDIPERFGGLHIDAPDAALAALAREVFAPIAPGPYDPEAVIAAVDRLYSTGLFLGIWPHVVRDSTAPDRTSLLVRLDAPARLSMSLGAGFENDRGGRAWAALERQTAIAHRPFVVTAAASTDGLHRWASLGGRMHALARPVVAWSIGAHAQERSVRTFFEDSRETVEVVRAGGWLGVELPYTLRDHVITLTGRAEWIDPEDAPDGIAAGPHLRIASLPAAGIVVGVPMMLEAEARWGAQGYRRVNAGGSLQRIGTSMQAALLADVRITSDDAPLDVLPALGDEHAIPGLRWGEMRGRARAVVGIDAAVKVPLGGFARVRLRSGAIADEPSSWQHARWISGVQIGGVWRIPFGTLEAGYGYATTGDTRFDVSIGSMFH